MNQAQHEAKQAAKSIQGSFNELGQAAQSLLAPFGEIGGALGQSLGSIGQTMRSVTDSIGPLVKELGLVGAGMASVAGAAAALGAAGAGIALFAAKGADELYEMSEKTGVSVEALSSLSYAAKQSGVSTESLATGLERMSRSAFQAATVPSRVANAFQRMGVSVVDASGQMRSTQDILEDLSAKFSTMANGTAKTALAMQVFGRAGADMLPFLNQGKEGIAALVIEANELGITLSSKTAEGAHLFEMTLDKIEAALTGASNTVLGVMLPAMQALSDFFVNDLKDPSGIFRELGSTIGETLVPAFKLLASTIALAVTMGDYFVAALSNGIQFVSQQIIGLSNAFADLKGGHFAEAGQELKSQFQQGLANFTKGVEDETSKADARLTKFFASTWFGADFSTPEKKHQFDTTIDVTQAKKQTEPTLTRSKLNIPNIKPPDMRSTVQDFQNVQEALQKLTNVGGVTNDVLAMGKESLDDFYSDFDRKNRDTVDAVNAKFSTMAALFSGLLALNAVSQADFNKVSIDLETERVAAIQQLQLKSGQNFAASFADAFSKIISDGDKLAAGLSDAFSSALKGVNDQFAELATGHKTNFREVGQQFQASVVKASAQKLESSATKHVAGLFGVHFGQLGSSSNNPLWTKNADGLTDHVKNLGQKMSLGNVGKDFGSAFRSITGSFPSIFSGGFGSILKGLGGLFGGLFGGAFAGGGDITPGRAYLVGENGPELITPRAASTVMPNHVLAMAGATGKSQAPIHVHFHGVTDADSFKASKSQILGHLANAVGRAVSRR